MKEINYNDTPQVVHVALSGASGMPYGLRLIEYLLLKDIEVRVLMSQTAQVVAALEMDMGSISSLEEYFLKILGNKTKKLIFYGRNEWTAPIASGSNVQGPLVVCPCSMGLLSAIATGASDNLLERACDVMLKERKKLILVPREAPFSTIHLENMLRVSKLGAIILPACPAFYHKPETIQQLVDFIVARILDHLSISHNLVKPWGKQIEY